MDILWITQTLLGIVISVMGWVLKTMYTEIKELKKEIQDTREKYVHKDDLKDLKQELLGRFDKLEEIVLYQTRTNKN